MLTQPTRVLSDNAGGGGGLLCVEVRRDSPAGFAEYRRRIASAARLHAETIKYGFLARLGQRFLRQVYDGIACDSDSCLWVLEERGAVLGFLAYSADVSAMFRRIKRARVLRLGFAALPAILNPSLLWQVLDTMRYGDKQSAAALPPAEILSVGVSAAARGKGVGRRLIERAVERAERDGQRQLKVLAGAKLQEANQFYPACGFRKYCELMQHGEPLNVYMLDLPRR